MIEETEKKLAQTLAIIINNYPNTPLVIYETALALKKTSLVFCQEYKKVSFQESYRRKILYEKFLNTAQMSAFERYRQDLRMEENSARTYPWKSPENCIYPSELYIP